MRPIIIFCFLFAVFSHAMEEGDSESKVLTLCEKQAEAAVLRGDCAAVKSILENQKTAHCFLQECDKKLNLLPRALNLESSQIAADTATLLLECGADIGVKDKQGQNVLHVISIRKNFDPFVHVCQHALMNDISPLERDLQGYTPMSLCTQRQNVAMLQWLLSETPEGQAKSKHVDECLELAKREDCSLSVEAIQNYLTPHFFEPLSSEYTPLLESQKLDENIDITVAGFFICTGSFIFAICLYLLAS